MRRIMAKPLLSLKSGQCKFAVTDQFESAEFRGMSYSSHLFCAAATDGGPYCAEHKALCSFPAGFGRDVAR